MLHMLKISARLKLKQYFNMHSDITRTDNIKTNVVSASEITVHIKVLVIAFKMKFSTYATL